MRFDYVSKEAHTGLTKMTRFREAIPASSSYNGVGIIIAVQKALPGPPLSVSLEPLTLMSDQIG